MKLLRLKLLSPFRSLHKGFELQFRNKNFSVEDVLEPICMVGLNGSGKSNTLEVICEIFYYLELNTFTDGQNLEAINERYSSLGFEVDYRISPLKWKTTINSSPEVLPFDEHTEVIIRCSKQINEEIQIFAVDAIRQDETPYPLQHELWKEVLPNKVIGYTSGQNELISNPFIRLDFHYFDEFVKSTSEKNIATNTDVNRMFFMDYDSNELVVLANYLFQDHELMAWKDREAFNEKLGIKQLHSFSIKIQFKNYDNKYIPFPSELNLGIERLKRCATTWIDSETELDEKNKKNRIIELSFFSDGAVRKAFRNVFKTPYELFRLLYLMRLMNIHCISPKIRNIIKNAPKGTNLSDLIPKVTVDDLVFKIDCIKFIKNNATQPIRYKQLSDGEHQLLHVIGTLRLMQERDVLFILDEPETHFNPEWRAKMIRLIMSNGDKETFQDHFITSHSPFIISDCKPTNVYLFHRDHNRINVQTAHDKRLNTFGTSVNILTEEVFNKNESQGDYSLNVLNEIKNRTFTNLEEIQQAKEDARVLGESVEKTLLFRKLLMIEDELKSKEKK